MSLARMLQERRPGWRRLEELLELVEHNGLASLDDTQAVELARLYRRTASDLNQAQTFVSGDSTVQYLNDLTARCYVAIHARTRTNGWALLRRLVLGYPALFRSCLRHFALACLLMLAGAVFGYVACTYDGKMARTLLLPNMPMIQPDQEAPLQSTGQLAGFSSFLFTNNTRVCLLACALGLTYGIGTALLMWYTGIMLGGLAAVFVEADRLLEFSTGVLPHGVLELPAALIGGAAGFILAEAMLRARPWPRLEELGRAGKEALWLVGGCVPLMAVAAVLEAGVARAPDWYLDSGFKLAVAALFGLAFLVYLVLPARLAEPIAVEEADAL